MSKYLKKNEYESTRMHGYDGNNTMDDNTMGIFLPNSWFDIEFTTAERYSSLTLVVLSACIKLGFPYAVF